MNLISVERFVLQVDAQERVGKSWATHPQIGTAPSSPSRSNYPANQRRADQPSWTMVSAPISDWVAEDFPPPSTRCFSVANARLIPRMLAHCRMLKTTTASRAHSESSSARLRENDRRPNRRGVASDRRLSLFGGGVGFVQQPRHEVGESALRTAEHGSESGNEPACRDAPDVGWGTSSPGTHRPLQRYQVPLPI